MAHLRLTPVAALCTLYMCALCLCAAVNISPALGAKVARAKVQPKTAHRKGHAGASAQCAKRSSFHTSGGHAHHPRHGASCKKRSSSVRHKTSAPHARSRHFKARKKPHRPTKHSARPAPAPSVPTARGGSCPDATLIPDEHDIDRIRTAVLCLVNRERTDRGERQLTPDSRLQQAAQGHTESMAFEDYFEHIGPRGETPLSRMRASGYIYSSQIGYEVGENIGWGTLSEATPRAVVATWMASPGHRANILDAHFRNTGVGISPHPPTSLAHHQAGGIYTQDFGVIIAE